ncbi:MAG: cobyric acid synthase [Armatimonadetes bacterium]|nr:cobyric acid synthase [Armatimonadota bacterium]
MTPKGRGRARTLMFQGTSSHAGKSWMTAAMCRILLQDGLRVAPFKAQNMSNNSYVARDGGELGRAQVLQAQACRLDPDTRMNPILLKPTSDTGCQIIVRGHPVGSMAAWDYEGYKAQAGAVARAAFDELAAEFDVVVLEGAGSPAEVNLKDRDIANMHMARHAGAPVLLVGDIDRGGVYASFVGTLAVLDEWERDLLRGFVVNKFRGDAGLLAPAHDYMLAHTGRPVLGVVPWIQGLSLPEEDGVGFDTLNSAPAEGERLDLVVLELPHVSNFGDFDPLRLEPDVGLRLVSRAEDLGSPDAVLLPGTKNTLGDLAALRGAGLADGLLALAGRSEIVGVCGGYQMLGRTLADPHRLESSAARVDGLGLLPVETVMHRDKTLCRVEARHTPSGHRLVGYEIHHGRTGGDLPPLVTVGGRVLGSGGEMIWGTYLHGLFDADAFRRWGLDRLRRRRGWEPLGGVTARFDLEPDLDRLAAAVRAGLDMGQVYRLMGLEP